MVDVLVYLVLILLHMSISGLDKPRFNKTAIAVKPYFADPGGPQDPQHDHGPGDGARCARHDESVEVVCEGELSDSSRRGKSYFVSNST